MQIGFGEFVAGEDGGDVGPGTGVASVDQPDFFDVFALLEVADDGEQIMSTLRQECCGCSLASSPGTEHLCGTSEAPWGWASSCRAGSIRR